MSVPAVSGKRGGLVVRSRVDMGSGGEIGEVIAGYRLEGVLGRGGMSVVYQAEHIRLGRRVALKLLAPALAHDPGFRQRFETEWRRAAAIDHPNIIPVYDAGEGDGQLYIAMRYVEGADLKSTLAGEGHLGIGRTLSILEQVAAALDAAHARGLVHRDVKPANILVEEPSEHVYLTDFGIVKDTQVTQGVTASGFFLGTVDYAAPEQIEGLAVDARTDVYALGCVLFECLVGRPPFARGTDMAALHAHLTEPPPLIASIRPELGVALNAVLERALAKRKEDRFPSCSDFIRAARSAALQHPAAPAGEETLAAPPGPAPPVRDRLRRRPPVWAAAAVLALAAGGAAAGAYFATRPDASSAPTPTEAEHADDAASAAASSSGEVTAIGDCQMFPSDNPWNRDVSNDPVDPKSDTYIARISGAGDHFLHADFGPDFGIPFTVVPEGQPLVPVTFTDYPEESDPGPYPIPPDAPIERTDDGHLLVLQTGSCELYELYDARRSGNGWEASSGAVFDLSSNDLRPDGWTSADGAGLPILPGLARYEEVSNGEINHALRFTVDRAQRAFIHPATHFGSSENPDDPPMGLRLRLKASYDISDFDGQARVILEALKRYGMIVADQGTSWFITGAPDPGWNNDDLDQLKRVPGDAFEVVESEPILTP